MNNEYHVTIPMKYYVCRQLLVEVVPHCHYCIWCIIWPITFDFQHENQKYT